MLPNELGGTGEQRIVHSIGFGNVAQERDRQGVPGQNALERLARNGTFSYAQDKGAFDAVFQDVARRIRNVYVYEYFSPNLTGEHTLVIEVRAQGRTARTELMSFSAGGSPLRATLDGAGRLTWTGPTAAVQSALQLTDRCTLAEAADTAEQACVALAQLARSTGDAATIAGVRTFMLGTICLRFPVSSCGGEDTSSSQPKPALGPSCRALVDTVNCLLAKKTPEHAKLVGTARKVNELLASMGAEAEPMCTSFLDELRPSAEEESCFLASGGIGAQIQVDGGGARVTSIIGGGGAEAAGLRSGDVIVAIDGGATAGKSVMEVVSKLRGEPGSEVTLTVKRDDETIEVRVTRKKVP